MKKQKFQPKFVVNRAGRKIGVYLNMKEYNALLEEVEDAYDIKRAEKVLAQKGKTHTLEEIEQSLLAPKMCPKKTAPRELKAMRIKTNGLFFDRDKANER
jgi:hypothetical protein